MDKRNLAFTRINYILLVVGMAIVVLGFLSGSSGLPHWFRINDFCGDV